MTLSPGRAGLAAGRSRLCMDALFSLPVLLTGPARADTLTALPTRLALGAIYDRPLKANSAARRFEVYVHRTDADLAREIDERGHQ